MTLSDKERVAAKVEEIDKTIAELQRRRRELLEAKAPQAAAPAAEEAPAAKPHVAVETPAVPAAQVVRTVKVPKVKNPLENVLDSLPWKGFKKKEGEWAFLRTQAGSLIDELSSEKEFVDKLRKEGEMVVGKYRYQVSEDKFLNRHYVGANAT